ncbi:restriction endonuclease subunit S [Rosistilla oblonga]|uniref:restriction endonuclease subunit S n=1 Tax=Rosistilla oblonga TaxID=2527990 RepID=UPI003A96FAB3
MTLPSNSSLGDHVEILSGFAFKSNLFSDAGNMPVIRIRDVKRGFSETFYNGEFDQKYVVKDGDLLIGMDGEFNREKWSSGPALLNQRVCKVVPSGNQLDASYLYHFLPMALKRIEDDTPFVTVKHLSVKKIQGIKIPLPPLSEQKRIAEILDRAESLRAKRRAALALLDELTQSIFLDMFGDPVSNPMGWKRVKFGDILENIDSGWSPKCLDRPVHNGEWGVLKLGAVTWCEYDPSENKALPPDVEHRPELEVRPGDLLFTRKNTYHLVAACALVRDTPPRLMLPDLVFRFRLANDAAIDSVFLQRLLVHPAKRRDIQKLAGGSSGSMPNISKARLQTVLIELPPLELQKTFAARVKGIEEIRESLRESTRSLDQLFASLQHRAFRGEL